MWEKYSTTRQATDDNTIRRIACWTPKATNTHSEHVTLLAFPCNHRATNACLVGSCASRTETQKPEHIDALCHLCSVHGARDGSFCFADKLS